MIEEQEVPQVMDELLSASSSLDIQWGNHGYYLGLEPSSFQSLFIKSITHCKPSVMDTRRGIIRKVHYGLNIRSLTLFADKTYKENATLRPILGNREKK